LIYCEQTLSLPALRWARSSRLAKSGTEGSAPYRAAFSVGSGSTWCWQTLHQTMSRTRAAAALPSVIGGPMWEDVTASLPNAPDGAVTR
jgi:hypothetical protein